MEKTDRVGKREGAIIDWSQTLAEYLKEEQDKFLGK